MHAVVPTNECIEGGFSVAFTAGPSFVNSTRGCLRGSQVYRDASQVARGSTWVSYVHDSLLVQQAPQFLDGVPELALRRLGLGVVRDL